LALGTILLNSMWINQSMINIYYALSVAQEKLLHLNQILLRAISSRFISRLIIIFPAKS